MPYADKETQRKYQREQLKQRKELWLKENGPCNNCGSNIDLEVDHVDPSTKVTHRIRSWSKARREIELAKCQVLCSTCHLEKTVKAASKTFVHGDRSMYDLRGCRCPLCRGWYANYRRKRRALGLKN